ncbi:MAG: penicillin acylase family protein, partial [Myxococcota bacterium]
TVPLVALAAPGCSFSDPSPVPRTEPEPPPPNDRAHYILPPGNFGGFPVTDNSFDQLALYDGLTPLRGDVTDEDIEMLFLPMDFQPIGETTDEPTGRDDVTITYDAFGVAHIRAETREGLAFGAGWVSNRDRSFLLTLARSTARVAVADVPGLNAFGLLLSGATFSPSAATEQLVADQVQLIIDTYGEEGEELVADAEAYAAGLNAWDEANGDVQAPWTTMDVVAITAFIGQVFGAGGGAEIQNAQLLSRFVDGLGDGPGRQAWDDVMLFDDPEAPTTIDTRFEYGPLTGGGTAGSVELDLGSVEPLDAVAGTAAKYDDVRIRATDPPPDRQASNWLIVNGPQSTTGNNLAVMGPQLGYYYPEIVMQVHLSGPGIEAQGAAVPGLAMYLLLGRTRDYSWSLTSANHDVRDIYVEELCNPDGSDPSRTSMHYRFEGTCTPFEMFDAGTLGGSAVRYPVSVHGQVLGTATVDGAPVALTRRRSTFGRDGLNLKALKDMTEGEGATTEEFMRIANQFEFTFNWGYASRDAIAYFSSGRLPVRPAGIDRRLPTLGDGDYEWEGFLNQEEHPHAVDGPDGRLLNWNNQAAPGFMHGDGTPYGSVHRVDLFDQFPDQVDLAGVVSVMNRAATEDVRSPVWPVVSEVLAGGSAPTPLAGEVVSLLDAWVADDAPQLDADDEGNFDSAGPTIMDALLPELVAAALRPVLEDQIEVLDGVRPLASNDGASLLDKDLRRLLGRSVEGPFNLQYCGEGVLSDCQAALWQVVDDVAQALASQYASSDPNSWLKEGARTPFQPGLVTETFRRTNRPTFQQVVEYERPTAAAEE